MGTRRIVALTAGLMLVCLPLATGCSSQETTAPAPSSSSRGATAEASLAAEQVASAQAQLPSTTPAPPAATTAGDLDAGTFAASVGRWKAVPGEGDEGTYQPNGSWVHALDANQVSQSLAMQGCEANSLPRAQHVLASDYKDAQGARAVAQALRFGDAASASAFLAAYTKSVSSCVGKTNPMSVTVIEKGQRLVDRRTMLADQTVWLEVVKVDGTLVRMFVANDQGSGLTAAEITAIASAA